MFDLLTKSTEISYKWLIESLNIYFGEFWEGEFSAEELASMLDIRQFTKDELYDFTELFRRVFLKSLNLGFDQLMISLRSSVFFYSIFGSPTAKKIFCRLENIFLATASDEDLDSYTLLSEKGEKNRAQRLKELKSEREKLISKTRKKSIFPEQKESLDNDPVLQSFLVNLDFSDQEVN